MQLQIILTPLCHRAGKTTTMLQIQCSHRKLMTWCPTLHLRRIKILDNIVPSVFDLSQPGGHIIPTTVLQVLRIFAPCDGPAYWHETVKALFRAYLNAFKRTLIKRSECQLVLQIVKVYFVVWRLFLTYVQVGPGDHKKLEKTACWNAVLEKYALHCWPKIYLYLKRENNKKKDWKVFQSYRLRDKRFWGVWHLPHQGLITARQQLKVS